MDSFLKWLLVGLTVMVLIYLFTGIHTNIEFHSPEAVNETPGPKMETSTHEIGYVGESNILASKTFWLRDFNASRDAGKQIFSVEDQRIYNGLLFGKKYIIFTAHPDLENYISSYVEFYISKTNRYGPLKVMVNNYIIGDQVYDVGKYTIPLNKSWLENETVVKIYPHSSSWRIWAPTVYDVSGASLVVEKYFSRPFEFKFNITDDVKRIRFGKIKFDLIHAAGSLKVFVNDHEVYNGTPEESSFEVFIPKDYLAVGENTLIIEASDNGIYRGSAFIDVNYVTTEVRSLEKKVYFDGVDYDRLPYREGKVKFHIRRIYKDGGFVFRIINSLGKETYHDYQPLKTGYFEYDLDQGLISIGENRFVIESIDGGAFDVDAFEIEK